MAYTNLKISHYTKVIIALNGRNVTLTEDTQLTESTPQPTTNNTQSVIASAAVVIPRTVFINYLLIAAIFSLLGGVIGSYVFPSTTQSISTAEVETIVRGTVNEILDQRGVVKAEPTGPVAGEYYQVVLDETDEPDPFLGNPNAPIVIVEYSDFTCGYCGRFARDTLTPLIEEFGDQVKLIYRDYPFLSAMSYPAAMAAECADDQGKFWELHDAIFANQSGLSQDALFILASDLGLDMDQFSTCVDEETHRDEIVADAQSGSELGQLGTPAFFVNGRFVSGAQPITAFREVIAEELERLQTES